MCVEEILSILTQRGEVVPLKKLLSSLPAFQTDFFVLFSEEEEPPVDEMEVESSHELSEGQKLQQLFTLLESEPSRGTLSPVANSEIGLREDGAGANAAPDATLPLELQGKGLVFDGHSAFRF